MTLARIRSVVWQLKNHGLSVESSSCSQPAKPDGGNGLEPLSNPSNKSKSVTNLGKNHTGGPSESFKLVQIAYITFTMEENNPPSDISSLYVGLRRIYF